MDKAICLGAGSLMGGIARYLLATAVHSHAGASFPYGTLAVNISGCFAIGLFDSWAGAKGLSGPAGRLFFMTGFCGAYTTFSTLIFETAYLVNDGQLLRAFANYAGSGVLGFVFFRLGSWLGGVV
ncbi:MAG: fluoride efflux transporter CrcB [Elusimicrobia bacterium]|nr:fluoride efflux transporter CrcB [Elusimicrobiota bacterium]